MRRSAGCRANTAGRWSCTISKERRGGRRPASSVGRKAPGATAAVGLGVAAFGFAARATVVAHDGETPVAQAAADVPKPDTPPPAPAAKPNAAQGEAPLPPAALAFRLPGPVLSCVFS